MSYSAADAYASPKAASASAAVATQPYDQPQQPGAGFGRSHAPAASGASGAAPAATKGGYTAQPDESDSEDEGWNVYDDFNNTKPLASAPSHTNLPAGGASYDGNRSDGGYWAGGAAPYSDAPGGVRGSRNSAMLDASSYGAGAAGRRVSVLDANHPSYGYGEQYLPSGPGTPGTQKSIQGVDGIELITVPALGAEFTDEEARQMRRPHKRRSKIQARKKKIGSATGKWTSGEHKLFGWLSPRVAVFMGFGFCIFLGLLLYFVIPRVPSFGFKALEPLTAVPNAGGMQTGYGPRSFSMTMNVNLQGDNRGGFVPSSASNLELKVTDLTTSKRVGIGKMDSVSFPGKSKKNFAFPVDFSYASLNATGDATTQLWIAACGPKNGGVKRPALNLAITLTMNIGGLIGRKGSSTQIGDVVCPFELRNDQT